MIPEWMLGTLLDYAKDGVIAGINQKDFDFILDKTLREFESKFFGFSRSDFKEFTDSPEVQAHFEQHLTDRELDFEYLGKILRRYVNVERDVSPKAFLRYFYDKFEINLVKNPQLKAQLDLRYQRSTQHKLSNIEESMKQKHEEVMKLLKCVIQKDVQKSDRKLCFQGQEVSDDQIMKLATNALKRARSKYEKGLSLTVLGKFDEAILQFDSAIEHNPECTECYFQRGNISSLQNKFREACEDYSEAIKLDPRSPYAWSNKGVALDGLGKSDEALKAYDNAIEINPKFAVAWYNKGATLADLDKPDDALKAYDKAIELNPQYAVAWSNKGNALISLGKPNEALIAYDKAIEIDPQLAEAWYNKGNALISLGKPDEALIAYDRAIKINPKYIGAWSNKSNALYALGKPDEALIAYDKAKRTPHSTTR